ncbi:MAG: hypothetical protein IH796_07630, partial [Deltaproteobacteria bacterium]|nr:hypothetical protein [Deltaproteobacteria bacterium]
MELSLDSAVDLNPGDEVMVIQVQGPGAGTYEFVTIDSIPGPQIALGSALQHDYSAANLRANVVRVPHFTDVIVPDGTSLTAPAWTGVTGGILAFRATGTVLIEPG